MIATSWPIIFSIWMLVAASVITTYWVHWTNKRILKLEQKVFELEMERDYPGWTMRQR
jgi:hypothetical protein